jgi:hypothetical protein
VAYAQCRTTRSWLSGWVRHGLLGSDAFGRRTYVDFYGYWPQQTDNPFTPYLNQSAKYVVSSTLSEPLPWQNSILFPGDPAAVRSW